ncbi:MAG: DNA methyltransferase [Bdellovibrionota bacterium]
MSESQVVLSFPGKEFSSQLAHSQAPAQFIEKSSQESLGHEETLKHNMLIRSDNIVALKTLQVLGCQFNFIYIDPPYNSKSKFTFNDNHKSQNNWLSMMLPRLLLAQKILAEDGIFFISIDDREVASLTILLREIFGEENHIGTLKWRKKRKPSFLDKHFSSVIEYVLIFAKSKKNLAKLRGAQAQDKTRPVLNASNGVACRILQAGTKAFCKDGIYKAGVYKNRTLDFELLNDMVVENSVLTKSVQLRGRFRVNQEILDKTVFVTKNFGLRRIVLPSEQTFKHATDDATIDFETNEDAETQLKNLFAGEKVFEFPKPVGFIKNLIRMYTSQKDKILCLDFFAGTATLAQAVYELNHEISTNKYSFCCVQSEEEIVVQSQFKTIADIAQARIELLEEKYKIFPKCRIYSPKL